MQTEVRLYDHLFTAEKPDEAEDYRLVLNPESLETLVSCQIESRLKNAVPGNQYQFERLGYFCPDLITSEE